MFQNLGVWLDGILQDPFVLLVVGVVLSIATVVAIVVAFWRATSLQRQKSIFFDKLRDSVKNSPVRVEAQTSPTDNRDIFLEMLECLMVLQQANLDTIVKLVKPETIRVSSAGNTNDQLEDDLPTDFSPEKPCCQAGTCSPYQGSIQPKQI